LLFVIFAVAKNYQLIVSHFIDAFVPVVIINLVCLVFFYLYGKMWKLKEQACRAISIEVSIENNALAMLVALQFFPNQIEVLMVSVLWGLWQLASGWPLATYWSKTKG
jgi:BASS family bile acid:Na+ symporter